MKKRKSLLKDEKVLEEIRRHKWIESEKAGREIGFATSALDWMKKYSKAWIEYHTKRKDK